MKTKASIKHVLGFSSLALLLTATLGAVPWPEAQPQASGPLYEIRSYHFEPTRFDQYRAWAENDALPHLRQELDVVGFWVSAVLPPDVRGAPLDSLGSANVTWIIRWSSKSERDARLDEVFGTSEWGEIFSLLPGGLDGYLRIEASFFEEL